MNNYVKHWKHIEVNPKGKIPLAISSDGDIISDLVREGNDVVDCLILSITLCLYSQFNSLNSNANCNLYRRYFHYDCTFRQQWRRKILFDAMHWRKNEVIGGLQWQQIYIQERIHHFKRLFFAADPYYSKLCLLSRLWT